MRSLYINYSPSFGRGVYTLNQILEGAYVMESETLTLSKRDTSIIQQTSLKFYTYALNSDQDLICLGLGSLLNHSDNPNLGYRLIKTFRGDNLIVFEALRTIEADEQLFINYQADGEINLKDYGIL